MVALASEVAGPDIAKLKRAIFRGVGYTPNPLQAVYHDDEHRFKLLAGGERAGKSFVGAKELLAHVPTGRLWWIVGPDYEQCRPEVNYILADLEHLRWPYLASIPQDGPCRILIQGQIEIATKSAAHPERLAGRPPDGVLMVEAAQQPFESYLKCQGRVTEKRGWLWLTGTFESSLGWYADLYKSWQHDDEARSFSLPTWSNTHTFPAGRDDPEIKRMEALYTPDRFLERLGGVPCPPSGRVLKEMTQAHVVPWDFDPQLPTYAWIDPGYAGAYAVEVAQVAADRVRLIDEVYAQGMTTKEVIAVCKTRPWWGRVRTGAIDVAGRQHHAEDSAIEIWQARDHGNIRLASQLVPTQAGLDTLRSFLKRDEDGVPKLTVSPRCRGFLAEAGLGAPPYPNLGVWRYPTDADNHVTSEEPIDRNNHAAKAVVYGLVSLYGYVGQRKQLPQSRYRA